MHLPPPPSKAIIFSHQLLELIRSEITALGSISFARFMQLALYTPHLGYYMNPLPKFGHPGDFTTAPETSIFFAKCLAKQMSQVLPYLTQPHILEFGAGTGQLMVDILTELESHHILPAYYDIVEISPTLRRHQYQLAQTQIPHLFHHIRWLDELPTAFEGVVVANEVLDAMPIHRFSWQHNGLKECHVSWEDGQLREILTSPCPELIKATEQLDIQFADGFVSEINLGLSPWLKSLSASLIRGLVFIIDYGFSQLEYYHPERHKGTLKCHYQHLAHSNPYWCPGLQDITSHVDFTAVQNLAHQTGFLTHLYTTQSHFLLDSGVLAMAEAEFAQGAVREQYAISQQLKKLLMPTEMGEAFKVMILAKQLNH